MACILHVFSVPRAGIAGTAGQQRPYLMEIVSVLTAAVLFSWLPDGNRDAKLLLIFFA